MQGGNAKRKTVFSHRARPSAMAGLGRAGGASPPAALSTPSCAALPHAGAADAANRSGAHMKCHIRRIATLAVAMLAALAARNSVIAQSGLPLVSRADSLRPIDAADLAA